MSEPGRGGDDIGSEATIAAPPSRSADISSDATVAAKPPRSADISSDATVAATGGAPAEAPDLPLVDPAVYAPAAEELARGGMGRIVPATDRRLGRTVALKELLAVGPEAAARFRREALITARLQHPAIVPVYEAGRWPSGEPFYAMKLVAGRPLDRVVAGCKTLEDRLALLPSVIAVCDAIAYAHSQRVVHRDLKPANVLIGDFGETVVIDWGLAKDLDTDDAPASDLGDRRERAVRAKDAAARAPAPDVATDVREQSTVSDRGTLTMAGAVMGTPAYMPPEQARGDHVDERADVFSLGAMLYHVLAGSPPYGARSATDVIAHAISGKVVPLKARAPRAPADLVAIVVRAMAHEPEGRYRTARELAEELRRFQTGQLVGAHRYTTWERVVRYVRRHRAAVTIAAIALVGFAVGGTLAVRRIMEERDRAQTARTLAERRRAAAEKLVDFMVSDMRDRLDAVGQLALMSGLGSNVRDYYADLSDLPGGMANQDVDRMTRALDILGDAERQSGDLDAALATFEDARSRLRLLVAREPESPETPRRKGAIARATVMIGRIAQARGKIDDALGAYHDAAGTYAEARAAAPRDRELLRGAADAHDHIGDLHRNRGDAEEAVDEYTIARNLRQDALDLATADGAAPRAEQLAIRFDLSTSEMKLGSAEQARGATRAALDHYADSVKRREELATASPDDVTFQHGLSYVRMVYADLAKDTGKVEEARAAYEASLAVLDALVRKDAENTTWRRDRGTVLGNLGFALLDLGDAAGALDAYRRALENHALLTARDPDNASWMMDIARVHTRAGDAHLHAGNVAAALSAYEESQRIREALVARDPRNPPWRRALAWSQHKIAGVLPFRGDLPGALAAAKAARDIRASLVKEAPGQASYKNELALSDLTIGRLELAAGRRAAALEAFDRAIELAAPLVAADPDNLEPLETLTTTRLARAEARLPSDHAGAAEDASAALDDAAAVSDRLGDNMTWSAILAEAHWVVAEVLAKGRVAGLGDRATHVAAARTLLSALARDGRLSFEKAELAKSAGASAVPALSKRVR